MLKLKKQKLFILIDLKAKWKELEEKEMTNLLFIFIVSVRLIMKTKKVRAILSVFTKKKKSI